MAAVVAYSMFNWLFILLRMQVWFQFSALILFAKKAFVKKRAEARSTCYAWLKFLLPFSSFCEELARSAISKTMINMNSIFLSAYPTTSKDDKLSGSQAKQISAIDSSNSGQISRIISSKVT